MHLMRQSLDGPLTIRATRKAIFRQVVKVGLPLMWRRRRMIWPTCMSRARCSRSKIQEQDVYGYSGNGGML
jgi:hypothetical protein